MSDILCQWVNSELQLPKPVDPSSFAKDFSSGYLIGKVLHKYELQHDFDKFSKSSAANSKLNNFSRLEPTLQLLGVPFDLSMAKAVIQERHGAATRLLYQLYIVLQKKRKLGLTGTAMETLQPAATARLHRVEYDIYTERLRTVVRREADIKLQRISQKFEVQGREIRERAGAVQQGEQQKQQKMQETMRIQDIEKHCLARRKQQEIMTRIKGAIVQIPKPPPNRTMKALERQRQIRKQREVQAVYKEIAEFEKNKKKLSPTGFVTSSFSAMQESTQSEALHIRRNKALGLDDAEAREQRAKRRRRFLVDQMKAHEDQQERILEEQLVERLTRQTQQEKRLVVQLMQIRQQKEVIRQNRIFQERQFQEQRQRDFEEALDREAALAQQARWEHAEEIRREMELYDQIAAERAQARYRKHFDFCREVLEQIVDLATKAGEYRLLTGNLIPGKLMREWKELLFSGKPLYERAEVPTSADPTPEQLVEMEKMEILNNQDYDEYSSMTGEWAWPEDGEMKHPPSNNNILGHVVHRLRGIANPCKLEPPPPDFPSFTLKACVLGKLYSGKTTCLNRIAQIHGVHILSASVLIQEAVQASQAGEMAVDDAGKENKTPESCGSPCNDTDRVENDHDKEEESSRSPESGLISQDSQSQMSMKRDIKSKLSLRAQHGAAVEKILQKGRAIPDDLQVEIIVEAIRQVPSQAGWILDGFPVNLVQAKLLEKALRGSDSDKADRKKGSRKSSLAVDPSAPKEPLPPSLVLDLVLLLDVSDNVALHRASKQTCKEETWPPAGEEASTGQDVQDQAPSAQDKSLEKKQIQHRITAFHDTWPKLEKWFSGKQDILVRVNAEEDEDALFKKVESTIYHAMARQVEKGEEIERDRQKTVCSTSLAPVAPSPVSVSPPAPTKSTPTIAQEVPAVRRSRSKSSSRSPKGSQSRINSAKEAKGKKAETPEGKEVPPKRSKSGSAHSGGLQTRSRRLSTSSSFEGPQGENTTPETLIPSPGSEHWVYVDEPLPKEIPEYLAPYWENVCSSYVANIKTVMQNLRSERDLIITHLYNIREDFKQYLKRPDHKQEFVSQWQDDYNTIPEDMRNDDETKAELHQRLDDLRECLWDISDKRKEDAEQECSGIMGDGWLEDHTTVLINHFATLMQVEVDRFQDSLYVLRDYYHGMSGKGLVASSTEFIRIPLVDITEEEDGNQPDENKSPTGSAHSERMDSSSEKRDVEVEDGKKTKILPLIPRRPPSAEAMSKGSPTELTPDERLLYNIWQTAMTAINNMVSVETQRREEEVNEEQLIERERMQRVSQGSAAANSAKDKKKAGKMKAGGPSPVQEPSPPPPVEDDEEELQRKAVRAKIRQEHAAALDHEVYAVSLRLELIKFRALSVVQSLQRRASQAHGEMEGWLGARFLAEMTSIDQLTEVARHHIELAAKIQQGLVLDGTDFFLNGDIRVLPNPIPPPRPPPWELPVGSSLTIVQLEAFYAQFCKVAPTGVLSSQKLAEILKQIISLNVGSDALPDLWMHLSQAQILELVSAVTEGLEIVDWRHFLLAAALPWPIPSQRQLLQVLDQFKVADPGDTGFVTEEQYLQMELWFPREMSLPIPDDPSEPLPYDRFSNLRKFFFTLFADCETPGPRLDYLSMLLYFASHPDPIQGFVRALSVVTGQSLKHRPRSSQLLKSVPCIEESAVLTETAGEPDTAAEAEVDVEGEREEEGVSIPALLKVICHGGTKTASYNRFHPGWKSTEEYEEDFKKIYRDLGFKDEEKVPFRILSQHPVFQELMDSTLQYRLTDIHGLLQAQLSEGKFTAS